MNQPISPTNRALKIQPATLADCPAMVAMLQQCAEAMHHNGMSHWLGVYDADSVAANLQHKTVYTLRYQQQMAGCVALSKHPAAYYQDCWPAAPRADFYLTQLAVMPAFQQHGYGKLLLQFCQKKLQPGQTLQLDAVAHYPDLLHFYRQQGFVQIAEGIGLDDKRYLFSWSAE